MCGRGRNRWSSWLIIKYQSSAEGPIKTAVGKHQRNQSHETKFTHTHAVVSTHTQTHTHTHTHTVEHVWWCSGLFSGLTEHWNKEVWAGWTVDPTETSIIVRRCLKGQFTLKLRDTYFASYLQASSICLSKLFFFGCALPSFGDICRRRCLASLQYNGAGRHSACDA